MVNAFADGAVTIGKDGAAAAAVGHLFAHQLFGPCAPPVARAWGRPCGRSTTLRVIVSLADEVAGEAGLPPRCAPTRSLRCGRTTKQRMKGGVRRRRSGLIAHVMLAASV